MINRKIEKICKDFTKIENYEKAIADNSRWECHHRLETHFSDGTPRPANAKLLREELVALGMYWDRPPEELIFLSKSDHTSWHASGYNYCKGRHLSEEHKRNISKSNKGKKHKPMSDETKKKLSEVHKGKPWTEAQRQSHGKWKPSESYREAVSKAFSGRKWWNNGIINRREFECPEGFVPGRLPFRKSTSN